MSVRKLIFEGTSGDRLVARLELPVGEEPIAYALFAHCFTCSKDLNAAVNVSRALAARRIGVFRFDFTGLGESAGDFAGTNFSSNVGDLLAAARFMEQNLEAPRLLVGHSLGGAAVIKAAAGLESVKAVATIGAPAEPSHVTRLLTGSLQELEERGAAEVRIAGRSFWIREQFLEDLEATRMEQAVGDLGGALLVFHSPVDRIVGVENAARIFGWAKHPKSFVSLDRADHLLTDKADSQYLGAVLAALASKYIRLAAEEEGVDTRTWAGAEDRVAVRIGSSGFRTDIMAGGHALLADEPESLGGTDTGPTPYDLLSASLGACTAMTLRMYADRKRLAPPGSVRPTRARPRPRGRRPRLRGSSGPSGPDRQRDPAGRTPGGGATGTATRDRRTLPRPSHTRGGREPRDPAGRDARLRGCRRPGGFTVTSLILCAASHSDAAWSYPEPFEEFESIAGYLSFYPGKLECFVDAERVKPQPGGFYGGWITSEIVGPFKGEPSTESW